MLLYLVGGLFVQLRHNLHKSLAEFEKYGFQDYFKKPLSLIKKLEKEGTASHFYTVPIVPNYTRINPTKLRNILNTAALPRQDPYEEGCESHYYNAELELRTIEYLKQKYAKKATVLSGKDWMRDSDPEYMPDDTLSDDSLSLDSIGDDEENCDLGFDKENVEGGAAMLTYDGGDPVLNRMQKAGPLKTIQTGKEPSAKEKEPVRKIIDGLEPQSKLEAEVVRKPETCRCMICEDILKDKEELLKKNEGKLEKADGSKSTAQLKTQNRQWC